jgi:hypothetical protein
MQARTMVARCLFGIVLAAGSALAPASPPSAVIVDRGLHRQWIVVHDPAHPERPPRLAEVPWSDSRAAQATAQKRLHLDAPLVRSGMQVEVVRCGGNADVHLRGTALESGWSGDAVLVRAGLHGLAERCIVRGPGLVEWPAGKAKS